MKPVHSTTKNPLTYVRIALVAALAAILAMGMPAVSDDLPSLHLQATVLGFLAALTACYFLFQTTQKRQRLEGYISQELNKVRRMYHLGLHIALENDALRPWFVEVEGNIRGYLDTFSKVDFSGYEQGNIAFRKATYSIYALPTRGQAYSPEIYSSLLAAAADATVARENIRQERGESIGRLQWSVLSATSVFFAVVLMAGTAFTVVPRFTAALTVFAFGLVILLLYEYDHTNAFKNEAIADRYAKNQKMLDQLLEGSAAK